MPADDLRRLIPRDESGEVVTYCVLNEYGWVTIEAAREAVAAYDRWADSTPRRIDNANAYLAVGPRFGTPPQAPVGWYAEWRQ